MAGIYGFDVPDPVLPSGSGVFGNAPLTIPEWPSLPLPNEAGATLSLPSATTPPELFPEIMKEKETVGSGAEGLFGLTRGTWDRIGLIAAGVEDAAAHLQGKPTSAVKDLLATRRGTRTEERAERTEARTAARQDEELQIKRAEFGLRRVEAQRVATNQVFTDADKYLERSEGLSPDAREAREAGLMARMAAANPAETITLQTMFSDRSFAEDIRVLTPHLNPRELNELRTNAKSWLTKEGGKQALRTAAESYAADDVRFQIANRALNVGRRLRAEGVTGAMDRDELRTSILDSGSKAELAMFEGTRFSEEIRKSLEDSLTTFGFSARGVAAKVAEKRATADLPLSQPLKDVLASEYGVDPRELDPTRKNDAALIKKAREKLATEETEKERAKFAPDLVTLKVEAERRAEAMKKDVEITYRGTGPLTSAEIGALRDDYVKGSRNFIEARDAFARMDDLTKDPDRRDTSAADVTRLYAYVKMQDPNAVREGELALVKGTGGALDKAANLYNQLLQGTATLTPAQRVNLEREVRGMFRTILKTQLDVEEDYQAIAKKRKADPTEAVPGSVIGRFRDLLKEPAPTKGDTPDERARKKFLRR